MPADDFDPDADLSGVFSVERSRILTPEQERSVELFMRVLGYDRLSAVEAALIADGSIPGCVRWDEGEL